jgi:hypothetical protein
MPQRGDSWPFPQSASPSLPASPSHDPRLSPIDPDSVGSSRRSVSDWLDASGSTGGSSTYHSASNWGFDGVPDWESEKPEDTIHSFMQKLYAHKRAYVLYRTHEDPNVVKVVVIHERAAGNPHGFAVEVRQWVHGGAKTADGTPILENGDELLPYIKNETLYSCTKIPQDFTFDSSIYELFTKSDVMAVALIPPKVDNLTSGVVAKSLPETNFRSVLDTYIDYEGRTRYHVVVLGACVAAVAAVADAGYHAPQLPDGTDKSHLLPIGRVVAWLTAGVATVWILNILDKRAYLRQGPAKAALRYQTRIN